MHSHFIAIAIVSMCKKSDNKCHITEGYWTKNIQHLTNIYKIGMKLK